MVTHAEVQQTASSKTEEILLFSVIKSEAQTCSRHICSSSASCNTGYSLDSQTPKVFEIRDEVFAGEGIRQQCNSRIALLMRI